VCEAGDTRARQTHALLKRQYNDENVAQSIRADDERCIAVNNKHVAAEQRDVIIAWARTYQAKLDERNAAKQAPYQAFEHFNRYGVED
jgi:hypothetical protein